MKTFIVLLRGINVGGQKKIRMADLRESLHLKGFGEVHTYIQSGNIICRSDHLDLKSVEQLVQQSILKDFGFDVPTLALTTDEIDEIINNNPFASEEEKSLYFVLLKNPPESERVESFNQEKFENEDFHITDRCVYLCCKTGYGKAKLSNNLVERKLKVEATARNLRTMKKLLEMADS
ncbi:DUF1697 domain-containing protein [Flagellimonas myxillae]|uniref:DUF1697 domain-containing protein n=1 Tax=Flagellimonas myxillae TaxID=2942214 RepID=UPI00201F5B95|nr:DUF1697 domain-containing protein [Muricauda myxillae]MCL6267604.1 DUF1697 domain-containing protein [Muricauda myxillae]